MRRRKSSHILNQYCIFSVFCFYIFRMLTEKIIKHFRVITVSGIHMGFLCMTKFALYILLSLNQSE